jgi:multiple sugar transport system substrate-binding protein
MSEPKKVDRRKFIYAGLGAVALIAIGAVAYVAMNPPVVTKTTTVPTTSVVTTTVPTTSVVTTTVPTTSVVTTTLSTTTTPGKVKLYYGQLTQPEMRRWNGELTQAFTQATGIEFENIYWSQCLAEFLQAIATGSPIDVCQLNTIEIWQPADMGALVALDEEFPDFWDVVKAGGYDPEYVKRTFSYKGKVYAFPYMGSPIMTVYNKKLLEDKGIGAPPKYWSEMLEAMKQVTDPSKGIWGWAGPAQIGGLGNLWWNSYFDFVPYWDSYDKNSCFWFDEKFENLNINSPSVIETLRFQSQFYLKGYGSKSMLPDTPLNAGKAAFGCAGSWIFAIMGMADPKLPELHWATQIPVPDTHSPDSWMTFGDDRGFCIPATSKHKKEAWEFIKFAVDKKWQKRLMELAGQLPFTTKLADDPYFKDYFDKNPVFKVYAEAIPHVTGNRLGVHALELLKAFRIYYVKCCLGELTPEEAAKEAQNLVLTLISG